MAKAVFVTYLIALIITISSAYKDECAIGPAYWCKSFQTAEDCGALRHCTDTVWRYEDKLIKSDTSTTCEWCQKILENTHKGIQHLANNEHLILQSLKNGCKLFPLSSVSSKCINALDQYGTHIASLMKHNRYSTLCYLMNICSNEVVETKSSTTEQPVLLGHRRCTWGPSYWCTSLSNTRECQSIDHCSNKVWSQQRIQKKPNDNLCQYCEVTIEKLRVIIEDSKTDINVEKWLSGACSMLPTKEAIDECVQMMSQYADEILVLIKTNIDPGVICHLSHMCKEATLYTHVTIEDSKPEEKNVITVETEQPDEQSKMLCNVIVQATYELHKNEHKNRDDIQVFLKNDCQKLSTTDLINKCENFVEKHGVAIHGHVASNIELSKVCDYIGDVYEYSSSLQSLPNVHCELCSFVLATSKYMLDAKQSEETVLRYIDEQICSRFPDSIKKTCKQIIETNGKELINDIQCGTKPALLCTRFHVCVDQVLSSTNSIEKTEKNEFIKENICDQLGLYKDACYALIEKDANRLIKTMINDMEGDNLCQVFGICPKKMSLLDNLAINDDKNKCQRCVDDFTRRKHIAEKLVNHSSEFLHHLCGQLPQKDECTKAVDDSIGELVDFVRSLDPQDICEKLKYCNETIQPMKINLPDDVINQEIIQYVKTNLCAKLKTFSQLCEKTIEAEGPAMLALISKNIDPKQACETMGICAATTSFDNCNDKCECCMDKIEVHEVQVATFLRGIVESIKTLCQHMPANEKCLAMTTKFDTNVNQITSSFKAKQVCQILGHCSTSVPIEIETLSQCKTRIESKKQFLQSSISSINQNLKSLCEYIPWNKDCYPIIDRSTFDISDKLSQLNSETVCSSGQSLVDLICIKNNPFESLCKQLVSFDENNQRMEAIVKSMFNQNGNLEKELCELQSTDCTVPSVKVNNCKDKCDCCVQLYTTKKDYDLKMIETLRSGFLATCDWSLTKDYCTSWFNRVCDRMKDKVDKFIPTNYCKQIGLCPMDDQQNDCKISGDKCQCCTKRLDARQKRFLNVVNEVTKTLSSLCKDDECRSFVQSSQKQTIDQIERINSQTYCQRYGYCSNQLSSDSTRVLSKAMQHIGSDIEALDERFETALSSDICFQYGQLRPMCEHLMASTKGQRYVHVYMALLKNDKKLIDDDLREQMTTKAGNNVCDACKNAVQSSKDFWINALDSTRDVLLRTCNSCPAKDQCQDYYNRRFHDLKAYINDIDPAQFCQSIHLCSTASVFVVESDKCSTCVDRLQARKDGALQAIDRVATYFDDICERFVNKQCQVFVQQIKDSWKQTIQNLDTKQICTSIGFCSTNDKETTDVDFDTYEKYLIKQLETNLCSTLGPFENLCQHVIQGNRKQIQTVKMNYNIKDLMQIGEIKTDSTKNFFTAANLNQCNSDKCQCCIDSVNQKKQCVKSLGDNILSSLISSCTYCPAKDKCQQFWKDNQKQFDSCIDGIDAKQVCTRFGFCNASTLCANMGVFQQSCEEILSQFTQTYQHDQKTLEEHLPHTSVVLIPTKTKNNDNELTMDSNATCILCEYVMNILANYIHQKSTEDDIERSLERVCQQMPSTLQKQCQELIENYSPVIIATLVREFDVTKVCQKLNVCTKQMKVDIAHVKKPSVVSCGVCDYVSTYIHFALKRDSSDESLKQALASVCTHLSSEQKPQCQTLVQLFAPHIRKLELHLGNNFCKQLSICQNDHEIKPELDKEDEEIKRKLIKNLDDTPQCTLCHYVISYLDAILKNNKSEAAVEAALEKVCTILPSKERGQCNEFVKNYGPVLAQLIAEMADPDTICRYLGVCQVILPKETIVSTTKAPPVTYGNHDYAHIGSEGLSITCTVCQFVISRMKHFAQLNQTEEEILVSLKKSCDLFSVINYKEQCEEFLDQYGSYIIQMISSDVDPKLACQSLNICLKDSSINSPSTTRRQSTPPSPVTSTTYGKCIYGMSYWCTSRQNAELCNAVELCENLVWSKRNKKIII